MQTLADLDRTSALTVAPDDSAESALERLLAHDATELYVVDADQRLLGIVPDYELLKARLNGSCSELTVAQIMSHRVLCFSLQTPVADVLKSFREGQHSRAALVEDGRLRGQVTRTALLRTFCESNTKQSTGPMAAPKFLQAGFVIRGFADALCS